MHDEVRRSSVQGWLDTARQQYRFTVWVCMREAMGKSCMYCQPAERCLNLNRIGRITPERFS